MRLSSHFKPNRRFRRDYNRLFKKDPLTANTLLLLCELSDSKGQVQTSPDELISLMVVRFEDPRRYAL